MGLATFFPSSDGAVPCGASAITQLTCPSSWSDITIDSEPAIEPNICKTMSESRSPSRLRLGMTSGSPVVESNKAKVASISCGS